MGLSTGKIFCLWMVILGILALLLGSVAPYWLSLEVTAGFVMIVSAKYGLWFWCLDDTCSTYEWDLLDWGDYTVWFYAVHALVGLATLIAIIALFLSLCSMCGEGESVTNVGVMALLSGLMGIAAAAVFYQKSLESLQVVAGGRDWAFIVFSCGTGVVSLFSIILLALPGSNNNTVQPY